MKSVLAKKNQTSGPKSSPFSWVIRVFFTLTLPLFSSSRAIFFNPSSINNQSTDTLITEERFISVNGIELWVTIKGERSKPVLMFLHGGPGSPLSPYADSIYANWKKEFILVQWDQRGAGKTYGRTAPPELTPDYLKATPLTLEQMSSDGIALAEYLLHYLGKQKLILLGTSWGSILGVTMAVKRPDLFYAYIGHSQVVNPAQDLIASYYKVYKMAKAANDEAAVKNLEFIGPPPYEDPKRAGNLLRVVKKYERINSVAAPANWFNMSPEYDNEKDSLNRSDGDDYSFANYMGYKQFAVKAMNAEINLSENGATFKIPVYFLQGEEDILTAQEITKEYFDKIIAPQKKFILIPKAAHGFNQSVVDMQHKVIVEYIIPLIRKK